MAYSQNVSTLTPIGAFHKLKTLVQLEKGHTPNFNQVMKDIRTCDKRHPGQLVSGEIVIEHNDIKLYPDLQNIVWNVIKDAHNTYPAVDTESLCNYSLCPPHLGKDIIISWKCDLIHHRRVLVLLKELLDNDSRFHFCGRANGFKGVWFYTSYRLIDDSSNEYVDCVYFMRLTNVMCGIKLRDLCLTSVYEITSVDYHSNLHGEKVEVEVAEALDFMYLEDDYEYLLESGKGVDKGRYISFWDYLNQVDDNDGSGFHNWEDKVNAAQEQNIVFRDTGDGNIFTLHRIEDQA